MTRTISKSAQNQIQLLLASNMTYEQVMERIPRMKAAPGRRATIGETTKSYIRRQVIKGEFKTAKAVHQYLNGLGYTISYYGALKLLKSMNFRAKIKAKKPLLNKQHKERRLAWAIAHKFWTTDDWRRMVLSDETKAMFSGQTAANITGVDQTMHYSLITEILQ
ncbi:hypothetical protein G6F55_013219 [Rhizopus delemar]|nr:hypothetical protein G6F55_013219 [Rhizopus delemar]